MLESQFNRQVDITRERLKYALDEVESDPDCKVSGGAPALNIEFGGNDA